MPGALVFYEIRKLFNAGSPIFIHEIDDSAAASISSIEVAEMRSEGKVIGRVCKIKLWDKNCAQERLFKHLRLFDKDNRPKKLKHIQVSFIAGDGKTMTLDDFKRRSGSE